MQFHSVAYDNRGAPQNTGIMTVGECKGGSNEHNFYGVLTKKY